MEDRRRIACRKAWADYTRKDGVRVTVPVVTIYRDGGEGITEYRVFLDLAPVFAAAPPA